VVVEEGAKRDLVMREVMREVMEVIEQNN